MSPFLPGGTGNKVRSFDATVKFLITRMRKIRPVYKRVWVLKIRQNGYEVSVFQMGLGFGTGRV